MIVTLGVSIFASTSIFAESAMRLPSDSLQLEKQGDDRVSPAVTSSNTRPYLYENSNSVGSGQWKHFVVTTGSSRTSLSAELTHISADLDLYVRKVTQPTLSTYDKRSFLGGSKSEALTTNVSGREKWYVSVHNPTGSTENFKLKVIMRDNSIAGWASETHFRKADTTIRERIAARAISSSGHFSGNSIHDSSAVYLTDIAYGDGQRIRDAMAVYKDRNQVDNATTRRMMGAELDSYTNTHTKNLLVDRIIDTYSVPLPVTEQETLDRLGIQKQCLEWAVSTAIAGGGSAVGYSGSSVSTHLVRPGMGFYNGNSHAALIIDVKSDANGVPTHVKVAEANYGNGWTNPGGQVAWERTVQTNRILAVNSYNIVKYDEY